MNRVTPAILLCIAGCVAGPGIFGATASDTSGAGGEASSGGDASQQSSSSIGSTTGDASADAGDPRLDFAGPGSDCEGLECGFFSGCTGPYPAVHALAMPPEGGFAVLLPGAGEGKTLLQVNSGAYVTLDDPPMDYTRLDLGFDPQGRAVALFGREDGYLLQLRSPTSYDLTWSRASPGDESTGRRTTTTDLVVNGAGTIHVAGYSVDEDLGAESTELFVRSYDPSGSELTTWTEAATGAPVLATDHADGTVIAWTAVDDPDQSYLVRRFDDGGEVVESHDLSFPIEIVGRPSRGANGWLVVGPSGWGFEVHGLSPDFAAVSMHSDIPEVEADAMVPRALVAIDDDWVVFVRLPSMEGRIALREYLADGTRLTRDPEVELSDFPPGDVAEVVTDGRREIEFFIVEDPADADVTRCWFDYEP